jgi:hypothetical protein
VEQIESTEQFLAASREFDERYNALTRLPESETVRLNSIWVTELYLPSHMLGLLAGIRRLGWFDPLPWSRMLDDDLESWIKATRSPVVGQAWYTMGTISNDSVEPTHAGVTRLRHTALNLPDAVESVTLHWSQVVPSITAITFECVLKDEAALSLMTPLRTQYQSELQETESGYTTIDPISQRANAVRDRVGEIKEACANVVTQILPGFFAEQRSSSAFPFGEFFSVETSSVVDLALATEMSFLDALGIEKYFDFYSDNRSRVLLSWQRSVTDVRRTIMLIAQASDLAKEHHAPQSPAGGRAWLPSRLTQTSGLYAVIAVREMLVDVTHEIGLLRDQLSPDPASELLPTPESLRDVETRLASLMADLRAGISEMTQTDTITSLANGVPEFVTVNERFNQNGFKDSVKDEVQYAARRMEMAFNDLVSVVQTYSALVFAGASEKAASSNLRLQKWTMALTIISTSIALVALYLAYLQLRSPTP